MSAAGPSRGRRCSPLLGGLAAALLVIAGAAPAGATATAAGPKPWKVVRAADATPTSTDDLAAVSCPARDLCVAVGTTGASPSAPTSPLVEQGHGGRWTVGTAADTSPPSVQGLTGVSCPTTTFCMAVGVATSELPEGLTVRIPAVETWNGTSWSLMARPTSPPPAGIPLTDRLTAVSCTSASFCVATEVSEGVQFVGPEPVSQLTGYADTWNGSSWTSTAIGNQPLAVSCAGPSLCAAVGTEGGAQGGLLTVGGDAFVATFTGSTWGVTDLPLPSGYQNALSVGTLDAVSCQATGCLATGSQTLYVENPPGTFTVGPTSVIDAALSGGVWSTTAVAAPPTAPAGLDCTATGVCVGVGTCGATGCGGAGAPLVEQLAGGAWTVAAVAHAPATGSLGAVACVRTRSCTAVGVGSGRALVATGGP